MLNFKSFTTSPMYELLWRSFGTRYWKILYTFLETFAFPAVWQGWRLQVSSVVSIWINHIIATRHDLPGAPLAFFKGPNNWFSSRENPVSWTLRTDLGSVLPLKYFIFYRKLVEKSWYQASRMNAYLVSGSDVSWDSVTVETTATSSIGLAC